MSDMTGPVPMPIGVDDVVRAGWSSPARLLRTGLVVFLLLLLALVVLAAIGILAEAGLLDWLTRAGPALGLLGLGGLGGAAGVAAVKK